MSRSDKADDASIEVRLTLGHAGSHELDVRVSPQVADEMQSDLEHESVYQGNVLELSAGQDLMILAASILGGGGGLAAALTAFFYRNRHKSVKFSYGDDSVEIVGYDEATTRRLMADVVESMQRQQAQRDAEWRRVLGKSGEEPGRD